MSREYEYHWSWSLAASPEALWPLASDTNRFNRDVGLPAVEELEPDDGPSPNARRRLRLRVKGVTLEWEELPFEWVRPHRFGVVRRYSRGPLREMRVLATLEEQGEGRTRLSYHVHARPRGLFGRLTTPLQIGVISRITFGRAFKRYAETVGSDREGTPPEPVVPRRSMPRLERAGRRLAEAGVEPALAERLLEHIATADDLTLARIRPYERAGTWGLPRRSVLSACLHATRTGLLDLSWDVICPRCLGAKDRADSLRNMREGAVHCDSCDVTFSRDFARSVEVAFTPTPAVRAIEAPPFCVAGPQITPHIEVQQLLGAGEERTVEGVLERGRHRIRAWGVPDGPTFDVERDGADRASFVLGPDGWSPPPGPVAPDAAIEIRNDTGSEVLFDVERITWADSAATAAEVTALADFRDLFSDEVLRAGAFVNVGNLAILFTDLKGSTQLYREVGDAPAFGRVMRHFDVLDAAVRAHDGAVIKTIGDAVMAVFREPQNALRAVREAQDGLTRDVADGAPGDGPRGSRHGGRAAAPHERLILKAGVHYGPCIAVNLDDRLDYFGSTVNIAARLGAVSAGDDVVVSDAVRIDPGVDELLLGTGAELQSFDVSVRGLEERLRVWRVAFADASPETPERDAS